VPDKNQSFWNCFKGYPEANYENIITGQCNVKLVRMMELHSIFAADVYGHSISARFQRYLAPCSF
jgi:hypothetical protein